MAKSKETKGAPKREIKDYYDTKKGLRIYLRKADPVQIQMISRHVKLPDQPTYEVKTRSGRTETHLLTAEVARDEHTSDEDRQRYHKWVRDYSEKSAEMSEISLRAIILLGTIVPDDYRDPDWERTMRIIGMKLPDDPDEYWVNYLSMSLDLDDQTGLTRAVIGMFDVDEELLAAAEESFSDSLHTEPAGPIDVADAGGDASGDSGEKSE